MEKRKCHCCKKEVTQMYRNNPKRNYRHKCPHGEWCVSGHPLAGIHANWPICIECYNARRVDMGFNPVKARYR